MIDPRQQKLAKILVEYSCDLKKDEKIWINMSYPDPPFVEAIIQEVFAVGGLPFVTVEDPSIKAAIMQGMTEELAKKMAEFDAAKMEQMDAYISIRNSDNVYAESEVPGKNLSIYDRLYREPVHTKIRVPKTKWVVLRYPGASMAQLAGKSTRAFEDYFFDVCNVDYKKMGEAMEPLVELMEKTDRVRVTGKGTDLEFSIKGIPAIKCCGERNIPDGEVYTAPVRESVNGIISYNTPSVENGFKYENIVFEFKDGKIINAKANDTERINKLLDTDPGARYIGEFSIGVNPNIKEPMLDTLFDEKINGSIHFTPGNCYDEAPNGNKSAIHWDLVFIQRPEYGGGEIYFDGRLIRKDGVFVVDELKGLNEENLK